MKKGILEQFENIEPNSLKLDDTFWKMLEENSRRAQKFENEKRKRIDNNFKELNIISKALNEPIPDELAIIIYLDNPIGSFWYKKYEKWFNYGR